KVAVLGTRFNVKNRGKRFEVECYEGRVQIEYQGKFTVITEGTAYITLDGINLPKMLIGDTASWMQNQIRFTSASLDEIIAELERKYAIDLVSDRSSKKTFTGVLPADDLTAALAVVCDLYELESVKANNQIRLQAHE
ncbi:MAG TPA: FecR domain-containing protein, partial [Flavobacterium sp.]|nr:FecR domain-containing protein [Flavobacterium sp.]